MAVVKKIPDIFSKAQRVIAIRNGDGVRKCCIDAIGSMSDWDENGRQRLADHARKHIDNLFDERYLRRLWPLQELALCNTVQFVTCKASRSDEPLDHLDSVMSTRRLSDTLAALAFSWLQDGNSPGDAYLNFVQGF